MASSSNPFYRPQTYSTTAEPGAFAPRVRSPKNEKRERILRHSGEKAIYFLALDEKTGRFTFLKVVLLVGRLFFDVYNLLKFIDKHNMQIDKYGHNWRTFL
jgi:hypothetical protein